MKYIAFLIIALVLFSCKNDKKPNIIIVMTDDQGYGEFSCNGNPVIKTPNIDRLADEGIRLTDFHVAPMCTPTRGQLLTGLDAFRNGAINVSSGRTLLKPELETMADIFKNAGYRTGIFGKWHLGDNYPFRPEDRGFDEALWFPSSHINSVPDYWNNDYFDDTYIHNTIREKYEGYCTDVFFDEAINWMKENDSEKPFLTYIPLNAAHWPLFVPENYRDSVRKAMESDPDVLSHLNDGTVEALVSFLAMGINIDENMGKLDQFLLESGMKENTIVVFLTDNGSTFGETYYNAGMKGTKTTLWEGGHRVPCFIRWPDKKMGEPREINELSQVQDLLPTLADLAGIEDIPDNLDGESLAPIFSGETETLKDRMLVINYSRMPQFEVTYTTGNPAIPVKDGAAVLWKDWRLLENRELYNVKNDPHQDLDVAAEHPGIVEQMSSHLDNWWDGVKNDVMAPQRVIIGSDFENPMMLTACEWLDVFVDQQLQIRRGVLKNGEWYLLVDQAGTYEFELRRWPRESELALQDSIPPLEVTDGSFVKGVGLPIEKAKIRMGDKEQSLDVETGEKKATFRMELDPGETTLQTWFYDHEGNEICGAYYVYVNRI